MRSMSWPRPLLVERRAGVVLGQYVLECRIVALNAGHGDIDELANGGLSRLGLEVHPAGLGRYPENVLGAVLVRVFGVGTLGPFAFEMGVHLLEGVGEMYFRKMRPRTTCLYSAASMLPRRASAMAHSSAS